MGVSGDQDILILLASVLQGAEKAVNLPDSALDPGTGIQFQIHKHLVVAGTSCVDLLTDVPKLSGQHQLDLGVDIFHIRLNLEPPFGSF